MHLPGVGTNRYAYSDNDPINKSDPSGHVVDIAVDAASLAIGVNSLASNLAKGDFESAVVDVIGIAVDAVAATVPGVAVGAGIGINAARAAARTPDAAKVPNVPTFGTPQKTGKVGHQSESAAQAKARAKPGSEVHFNRSLSTILGVKISPNLRPDVTIVNRRARAVEVVEIKSKLDSREALQARITQAEKAVRPFGWALKRDVVDVSPESEASDAASSTSNASGSATGQGNSSGSGEGQ
jgi:hypothetical protein